MTPESEPLVYLNGQFLPASQLVISPDDLGFLQGVSISERIRTFHGQLFRLDEHLERLANSLHIVGLLPEVDVSDVGRVAEELAERNRPLLADGDDLGLALFVTPGLQHGIQPTIGMQAYRLPFDQWVDYYRHGQALTETGVRQVPSNCWPAHLKCRSRMHYYLADHLADRQCPGSRAILLDQDGFVSEASTANVVVYLQDVGVLSPPQEKILPGVSLAVLSQLCTDLGVPFQYRDLTSEDLARADEILLCSTSPCVWPVTKLNGQSHGPGVEGPMYGRLLAAWSELVDLDIAAQAERFAHREGPQPPGA